MIATVFMDILPMLVGLVMGAFTEYSKTKSEQLHEERLYALKATREARKDQSKSASWSRKFIVQSVIGSLFLFPMLLTVMNFIGHVYSTAFTPVAIYVPKEIMYGGFLSLIFTAETVNYIPIYGFVLLPVHILIAQTLVGYYFGASSMKR
jgi:predicted histidine transporter YuiF (NhaC family)